MKKLLNLAVILALVAVCGVAHGQDWVRQWNDFKLDVSRDAFPDMADLTKFGQHDDLDIGETVDLWQLTTDFVVWPADSAIEVLSSDAQDDSAAGGTGAWTVFVQGIDDTWTRISETTELDGATPVTLANEYLIIYRAEVREVGTGLTNAGNLTFRTATNDNAMQIISAGKGQTLSTIFPIAADETGYLYAWSSGSLTSNLDFQAELYVKPFGWAWQIKEPLPVRADGNSAPWSWFPFPLKIEAKSVIKMVAAGADANNAVATGKYIVLLDK